MDPSKRNLLKLLGGILSTPLMAKLLPFLAKEGADVVEGIKQLRNTSTNMPDWFPTFVQKFITKNADRAEKIDQDITKITDPDLPDVEVLKYDDGRIEITGKNEYGQQFGIDYSPPSTLEDGTKFKGDFQATDTTPVYADPDGNVDYDAQVVENIEEILGGDSKYLENYAKDVTNIEGRPMPKDTKGSSAVREAEGRAEALADEARDFGDYGEYADGGLTDTIPPERGPMADGLATLFKKR